MIGDVVELNLCYMSFVKLQTQGNKAFLNVSKFYYLAVMQFDPCMW